METKTKKRKNGNDYLKEKIAKLEAENTMFKQQRADSASHAVKLQEQLDEEVREHQALENRYLRLKEDLQKTIEKQQREISKLTAELECEKRSREDDVKHLASMADDLLDHMGWLRRWLWITFRADNFVG